MTKQQFLKKFKQMLKEHNAQSLKEAERLFDSGGIDPLKYCNDFVLPRIVMHVVLKNEAFQYIPFTDEYKRVALNLEKF
jgi:hypothetical protein